MVSKINTFKVLLISLFLLGPSSNLIAQKSNPTNAVGVVESAANRANIDPNAPTINPDDLEICSQACAFETAKEALSAAGFYFTAEKTSSKKLRESKVKELTKSCIQNPNAKGCEKHLLNVSLHYNFARDVRDKILYVSTSRENLRSLDPDNDTAESPDVPWLRKDGTWANLRALPEEDQGIAEEKRRNNYFLDLDKIRKFESFSDLVGEDFVKKYGQFMNAYSKPDPKTFAKDLKSLEERGRNLAAVSDLSSNIYKQDAKNKIEIDQRKFNAVEADHKKASAIFRTQQEEYIRNARSKFLLDGKKAQGEKREIKLSGEDIPEILAQDGDYLKEQRDLLNQLVTNLNDPKELTRLAKEKNKTTAELLRSYNEGFDLNLPAGALSEAQVKQAALKKSQEYQTQIDAPGYEEGEKKIQVAKGINKQIQKQLKQQEEEKSRSSGADTVDVSYTLSMQQLDQYLDDIWPTKLQVK